jgi:hypothetical protein
MNAPLTAEEMMNISEKHDEIFKQHARAFAPITLALCVQHPNGTVLAGLCQTIFCYAYEAGLADGRAEGNTSAFEN